MYPAIVGEHPHLAKRESICFPLNYPVGRVGARIEQRAGVWVGWAAGSYGVLDHVQICPDHGGALRHSQVLMLEFSHVRVDNVGISRRRGGLRLRLRFRRYSGSGGRRWLTRWHEGRGRQHGRRGLGPRQAGNRNSGYHAGMDVAEKWERTRLSERKLEGLAAVHHAAIP